MKLYSLNQTFIKVKEEKLFLGHNKTLNIEILPPSFRNGASGWTGSEKARAHVRPVAAGCIFSIRAATAKLGNTRTKPQNKN